MDVIKEQLFVSKCIGNFTIDQYDTNCLKQFSLGYPTSCVYQFIGDNKEGIRDILFFSYWIGTVC